MHPYALPSLPALAPSQPSRSRYRCRKGSTTKRVRYTVMSRQTAAQTYQEAERFERATRQPGKQDGAIGRNGLAVLRAFLFGFLNWKTGQCDPGHATIARRAGISERSVRRGLKKLAAAGVVHWVRRCAEAIKDGRFTLEQQTNAYAVLPASQWAGEAAAEPPPPEAGTWGDHPPLPDVITTACIDLRAGASSRAILTALEADPGDGLASALARFGRAITRHLGGGNG